MMTLMMDTSFRYLNLAIYQDDKVKMSFHAEAFKTQSETILLEIQRLFKEQNLAPQDLQAIVLTDGPGSYTGLRISMTVAKVLATIHPLEVYTVSSLQAMAGLQSNMGVVMDARAQRVYTAHYDQGKALSEERVMTLDEATMYFKDITCVGDADLIGQRKQFYDIAQHVLDLKSQWKRIEDVDGLLPRYLKEY